MLHSISPPYMHSLFKLVLQFFVDVNKVQILQNLGIVFKNVFEWKNLSVFFIVMKFDGSNKLKLYIFCNVFDHIYPSTFVWWKTIHYKSMQLNEFDEMWFKT
jgi:hypothetical protein